MDFKVYIIQERAFNRKRGNWPIKIGHAKNVDRRLQEIQVGNSRELIVVEVFGPYSKMQAQSVEKALHRKLESLWLRGEWFRGHALRLARKIMINQTPPESGDAMENDR